MKPESILFKISLVVLFTVLQLGSAQFNPICKGKRYMCDYNNQIQEAGVCMIAVDTKSKLNLLKPCTNPLMPICNYTTVVYNQPGYCVAASTAVVVRGSILPGEKCKINENCYSGVCLSGFCRGNASNQTCESDYDCDVGLYCSNLTKVCLSQKLFSGSCTRDNECANNCACNEGTCVYYYSFDNFLEADNPLACSSGYIQNGTCYPALRSEFKGRPCTTDEDCTAFDYKNRLVQYGQCECGFNGGGFSYCSLAEGDEEFTDLKNKFAFVVARNSYCHTVLRFGPCSKLYNDEYVDYTIASKYFYLYPQLVFNDPCIKRALTHSFWSFLYSPRNFSTESLLICSVMFSLLFIFV